MYIRNLAGVLILLLILLWQALPEQVVFGREFPLIEADVLLPKLALTPTGLPDDPDAVIVEPVPGQAVQGVLVIRGSAGGEGFQNYQLAFAYHDQQTSNWFPILESQQSVTEAVLGEWDTTIISDGDYDLRLRVMRQASPPLEVIVGSIRVRNYTAVETATPTPINLMVTIAPGDEPATATATASPPPPTPTPLPPNPAELTPGDLIQSFGRGILVAASLITFIGIYHILRSLPRS